MSGHMVRPVKRKSMVIRKSGRSSDFISPSFGFGCLLDCTYCYMKRHKPTGLDYATNIDEILNKIDNHSKTTSVYKPNQTDSKYITYDIACNEDFALHSKYYDWKYIFEWFRKHDKAKATLATKIVPTNMLEYNPDNKVRIRFSMMPQKLSSELEPNSALILDRIVAANLFKKAGYDVHLNFSPVLMYKGWQTDYEELFKLIDDNVKDEYKEDVLAEVIFLTHNKKKHEYNLETNKAGEHLLWNPEIQEDKISEYGGENIRYNRHYKKEWINQFIDLQDSVIPWNKIRYIF